MKRDKLTPIELECNMGKDVNGDEHREPWKAYDIDEVDALLAKKDAAIAEKDAEIRRLNHKYWSDKADEAAKMKRLIYNGEIIYFDEYCNKKDWRIMRKVWEDEETKCRAKAEEYK